MTPGPTFTVDDLKRVLDECAGGGSDLRGDIADAYFDDLGYDSLALMETGAQIGRIYGIEFDDGAFVEVETPADLVAVVNVHLALRLRSPAPAAGTHSGVSS